MCWLFTLMAASIKKVAVVGPLQSGKSCISNFLSQYNTKPPSATYMPTVGCRCFSCPLWIMFDDFIPLFHKKFKKPHHLFRILEFEKEVRDGKTRKKHSFEIWDVSGNRALDRPRASPFSSHISQLWVWLASYLEGLPRTYHCLQSGQDRGRGFDGLAHLVCEARGSQRQPSARVTIPSLHFVHRHNIARRYLFSLILQIALLIRSPYVTLPSNLVESPALHVAWLSNFPPPFPFAAKALSKIQCTSSSLGPSNSEVIDSDMSPIVAAFDSLLAGVRNSSL